MKFGAGNSDFCFKFLDSTKNAFVSIHQAFTTSSVARNVDQKIAKFLQKVAKPKSAFKPYKFLWFK